MQRKDSKKSKLNLSKKKVDPVTKEDEPYFPATKEDTGTCDCGMEDSDLVLDPFEYDMNNKEVWKYMCSECQERSSMNI